MAAKGGQAQFTYDFGIAIAQSTVNKVARLTGATLTLASAFYALKSTATEYVDTLRKNTLRFGGVLSTLKAIEQAQNRLIRGQSYFNVDDQLRGMNTLMAVGVDVEKRMGFINKAAHSMGMSYSEFSSAIAQGIQGNMGALVSMGLLTERSTRMFEKYQANTIMRQQAILSFVENHRGLITAIKNDFPTIQDQAIRLGGIWKSVLKTIVGKPNDPGSLYGQTTSAMKMVTEAMARNADLMQRYSWVVGQYLGYTVTQVGKLITWLGRQAKKVLTYLWDVTGNFQERTRASLVWVEFWKLKILDFFKTYESEIKTLLKLLLLYKATKLVFVIGKAAIMSVIAYKRALQGCLLLQSKYLQYMGPAIGNRFTRWLQSLAAFMPRWARRVWVSVGKFFERLFWGGAIKTGLAKLSGAVKGFFGFLWKGVRFALTFLRNIPALLMTAVKALRALWVGLNATNPIGWIILAVTAFALLYAKCKTFREFVNNLFGVIWESLKFIGNSLTAVYIGIRVALDWIWDMTKKLFNTLKGWMNQLGDWIGNVWDKLKDSSVGRWIDKWIVQPLTKVFSWMGNIFGKMSSGLGGIKNWFKGVNNNFSDALEAEASKRGYSVLTFRGTPEQSAPSSNPITPASTMPANPLTQNMPISSPTNASDSTMTFNQGAVQIIVQGGEGLDEDKLARKVKDVILELERSKTKRGGY